ncbi:MAG: chorismate mutase [Hyphomicrobiales bacterium]|nr:chorismate mutase [Hyphomicrobiales bacterium]
MARDEPTLDDLRREIDDIDNRIHDLIQRRTEVVERVRDAKAGQPIKIRPSREAQVLERLARRHKGPFPRRELMRIWRELIVATLSFEGPFSVAVFDPEGEPGYWDLARDQYGSFTPMTSLSSPRRVIEAVRSQQATVGILPVPRHEEEDPWWPHLMTEQEEAPRVIARLPFAGPGNARGGDLEAVVICPIRLDETGRDRTFLAMEAGERIGTSHLRETMMAAGLEPDFMTAWKERGESGTWLHLVDVDGLIRSADPRVDDFMRRVQTPVSRTVSLGGYARPLGRDELD